jgi:hypothetical protein
MEKVGINCRPEKIAGIIRIKGVNNSSEWFKHLNPRNFESFLELIVEEQ